MRRDALPPVPGADGEPRPPSAPRVDGPWQVTAEHHAASEGHYVANDIDHPLLETAAARAGRLNPVRRAAYALVAPAILFGVLIVLIADDYPVAFMVLAGALAVVFAGFLAIFARADAWHGVQAGAHALASDTAEVPLYALTKVELVGSRSGHPALRLTGPDDELTVPCGLLEGNQQLWDLVYNGIRHSAEAGAEIDEHTRKRLRLS